MIPTIAVGADADTSEDTPATRLVWAAKQKAILKETVNVLYARKKERLEESNRSTSREETKEERIVRLRRRLNLSVEKANVLLQGLQRIDAALRDRGEGE